VKPPLTFLAIAVALTAAGCGGGTVIDPGAAEEDIRAGFAARDATVTSIDCPSDVDAERGGTYECDAASSRWANSATYRPCDDEGSVSQPRLERIGGGAEAP